MGGKKERRSGRRGVIERDCNESRRERDTEIEGGFIDDKQRVERDRERGGREGGRTERGIKR